MEHSTRYEQVKKYYDKGLWTLSQVRQAVKAKWITQEEFEEITGETY